MMSIRKRSRQFFRALRARMTPADLKMIEENLNELEKKLFFAMDTAVQKHCVNVAATALDLARNDEGINLSLLIKAALLHDIGKTNGHITLMDRVWYVLVKKISRRLADKLARPGTHGMLARLRNSFYIHIHHAEIGASMAQKAGLGEEMAFLLHHHHDHSKTGSFHELKILHQADELN